MKTSMFNSKNFAAIIFSICICVTIKAQPDSTLVKRAPADTTGQTLNMDAVYNRPFLSAGKLPIAIGGYLEANTQYAVTDGVSDGFSFQMRRWTLFFSSTIADRIKFL